jgi:hypothetical protein
VCRGHAVLTTEIAAEEPVAAIRFAAETVMAVTSSGGGNRVGPEMTRRAAFVEEGASEGSWASQRLVGL